MTSNEILGRIISQMSPTERGRMISQLPAEERLKGLSPEDILKDLSPEARETLKKLLQ